MEEYVDDAEYVILDEELRESYDKEWALKDLGHQQGYVDGYEMGKTEGIEQGKLEGIEQGKLELTKKMLSEKIDIETISKITGLDAKEIKDLE